MAPRHGAFGVLAGSGRGTPPGRQHGARHGRVVANPELETPAASAVADTGAADQAEADARQRGLERARRGVGGTIATSGRGVLEPLPAAFAAGRKSLLGE